MFTAKKLQTVAILVDPDMDNVALVYKPVPPDMKLILPGRIVIVQHSLAPGDRFALRDIRKNESLIQYGHPFAKSRGIQSGEKVTSANAINMPPEIAQRVRPVCKEGPFRPATSTKRTFDGYRRPGGRCGTRNHFVVMPTSMCASDTAVQIASAFAGEEGSGGLDSVVSLPHTEGCGCAAGLQIERLLRTLRNTLLNPNVGGALVVDLGCEQTNRAVFERYMKSEAIRRLETPIDWITIQEAGGVRQTIRKGIDLIGKRIHTIRKARRTPCPLGRLIVGAECGASDAFSGISANRVIGNAVDRIIGHRGSAVFSELPEMVGAEPILFHRMKNKSVLDKYRRGMSWYADLARRLNTTMDHNLVPENRAGGLMNPIIKSLGAVMKGGTAVIEEFLDYGEAICEPGLYIMQGPGNDLESVTGLVASGTTVICFSTGRGSVCGSALAPVIKISSNTHLSLKMPDDIDFDAGRAIGTPDLKEAIERLGTELFDKIISVASGEKTKPEIMKQRQFQVWTAGKLSL
jgi:altronate hydrolase